MSERAQNKKYEKYEITKSKQIVEASGDVVFVVFWPSRVPWPMLFMAGQRNSTGHVLFGLQKFFNFFRPQFFNFLLPFQVLLGQNGAAGEARER